MVFIRGIEQSLLKSRVYHCPLFNEKWESTFQRKLQSWIRIFCVHKTVCEKKFKLRIRWLPSNTLKLPLHGPVYTGVCVSPDGSLRVRGFWGWECNCGCVSLNIEQYYSLHKSAIQYTANNFPFMYSQKRFSQALLLISIKYIK